MEMQANESLPTHCPVCESDLTVTSLQCVACGTEVTGIFSLPHLASLREPHASLIDMFLRSRGNMKELERDLGLSYPTVRARLEEALLAAGYERSSERVGDRVNSNDLEERVHARVEEKLAGLENLEASIRARIDRSLAGLDTVTRRAAGEADASAQRKEVLDRLERREISPDEAATLLRALKSRR